MDSNIQTSYQLMPSLFQFLIYAENFKCLFWVWIMYEFIILTQLREQFKDYSQNAEKAITKSEIFLKSFNLTVWMYWKLERKKQYLSWNSFFNTIFIFNLKPKSSSSSSKCPSLNKRIRTKKMQSIVRKKIHLTAIQNHRISVWF